MPQEEAVERLEKDTEKSNAAIEKKEEEIEEITTQMGELKKSLYAKFGNAINLEVWGLYDSKIMNIIAFTRW